MLGDVGTPDGRLTPGRAAGLPLGDNAEYNAGPSHPSERERALRAPRGPAAHRVERETDGRRRQAAGSSGQSSVTTRATRPSYSTPPSFYPHPPHPTHNVRPGLLGSLQRRRVAVPGVHEPPSGSQVRFNWACVSHHLLSLNRLVRFVTLEVAFCGVTTWETGDNDDGDEACLLTVFFPL